MREERIKILSMVEADKITVDEAERLFKALYLSRKLVFEQSAEDIAGRVSRAAKKTAILVTNGVKTVTPKVIEITRTVVAKTAEAAEGLSKQVREYVESRPSECDCGSGGESEGKDEDTDEENKEN